MTTVSPPNAETPTEPIQENTLLTQIKARLPQLGGLLQQQGALVALVIVVIFSSTRYDNFDITTIYSILNFNAQFGLIALGMTFVIMTGGIDLSVGASAAMASVVVALNSSHGFFYAMVAGIIAGAAVGVINGFVIAWMGLPPFIVTLATQFAVRGFALKIINDADNVLISPKSNFDTIGATTFGNGFINPPLPFTIVLLFVAFIIGIVVLRYTRFGRYVLAIGGNAEATRLMGLPVKRTLLLVYTLSGALAGLAGVLLAVNLSGGSATEGNGWELIAIASVVVGGTLLSGGVGSVFGTLVGVLLLGTIVQILQLENNYTSIHNGGGLSLSPFWQDIIRGGFLLIVVLLQSQLERRRAKKTT